MQARPLLTALALLVPLFAGALPTGAQAPSEFPCDKPTAGLPCNLRMTFAPNKGNENYIVINPASPDNIVATSKDYGLTGEPGVKPCDALNVWTGFYSTPDGGKSWTNGYQSGWGGSPVNAISGYKCSTDAVIGVDNAGAITLSGLAYNNTGSTDTLWASKSTDGGKTFGAPSVVDTANFDDKNWLAVDPDAGHLYFTWTLFNSGSGIHFRRALNGDLGNVGPRIKLSSSGGAQGSFPAVGPDGTLYVIWNNNILGGNGNMYLVKSTDHGASFTSEKAIFSYDAASWSGDAEYRTPTIPQLAIDRSQGPHRGTLYVVYQGKKHGDPDAFLRSSRDGGETWSGELRLNDDAIGNKKGQNFPAIAVDPTNGWVHVVFYDRRDDPDNRLLGVYYTVSKDGGATWSKNQRVTSHMSDPSPCKHQSGATFIGDYMGLAAHGGKARPAFVDTRNGRCDLYTALLFAGPRLLGSVRPHFNLSVPEELSLKVNAYTDLDSATAEVDLPTHWSIADAGGGTVIPGSGVNTIRWELGPLSGDRELKFRVTPHKATVVDVKARLDWSLTATTTASGQERWNTTVYVSYPVLELNLTVPFRISQATFYNVSVLIQNLGYGAGEQAAVELLVPNGTVPVPKGGSVSLAPGAGLASPTATRPATPRCPRPRGSCGRSRASRPRAGRPSRCCCWLLPGPCRARATACPSRPRSPRQPPTRPSFARARPRWASCRASASTTCRRSRVSCWRT